VPFLLRAHNKKAPRGAFSFLKRVSQADVVSGRFYKPPPERVIMLKSGPFNRAKLALQPELQPNGRNGRGKALFLSLPAF
jgi:hypothetical protein